MQPSARITYHLDESCDPDLADGLRRRGIDITTSQEVGLLGTPDPVQLAHAHSVDRVLVTHDADFIALHRTGIEHSGIIYCHQHRYSLGEVIRRLVLVWQVYEPGEMVKRLDYL